MQFHGRIDNYLGIGVNNLIKDGAILTCKIDDIIKHYPQFVIKKRHELHKNFSICVNNKILNNQYIKIAQIIKDGNCYINEILDKCQKEGFDDMNYVIETLALMELDEIIRKDFSGGYKLIV